MRLVNLIAVLLILNLSGMAFSAPAINYKGGRIEVDYEKHPQNGIRSESQAKEQRDEWLKVHEGIDLPVVARTYSSWTPYKGPLKEQSRIHGCGSLGFGIWADSLMYQDVDFGVLQQQTRGTLLSGLKTPSSGDKKVVYDICFDMGSLETRGEPFVSSEKCDSASINIMYAVYTLPSEADLPDIKLDSPYDWEKHSCTESRMRPTLTGGELLYISDLRKVEGFASDLKGASDPDGEHSQDENEWSALVSLYMRAAHQVSLDMKLQKKLNQLAGSEYKEIGVDDPVATCKKLGFKLGSLEIVDCVKKLTN